VWRGSDSGVQRECHAMPCHATAAAAAAAAIL